MKARRLDGVLLASLVRHELKKAVLAAEPLVGRKPCLAVVLVEGRSDSDSFVSAKQRAAAFCGMQCLVHRLPFNSTQADVIAAVDVLNNAEQVDGIIAQLPLPSCVNALTVVERVAPTKDVDGLHPANVGQFLYSPSTSFCPCTALGIRILLDQYDIPTKKKHAVVVGRSAIAGRPVATMLAHGDATTTLCHRHTENLAAVTKNADILVCAAGVPSLITASHVKPGAVVIDVGINVVVDNNERRLVGDVDPEVAFVAGALTPVPGGVGPMTVCSLLLNTFQAYCARSQNGSAVIRMEPLYSVHPGVPITKLLSLQKESERRSQ